MKKSKNRWKKVIVIIVIVMAVIIGGGYIFIEYLKSELKATISGCKLESNNFRTVIDFEYINNWIVIQAKVGGSDKEFPFIFDTGAQTVIMDSLLKEISKENYKKYGSSKRTDTINNAFNNGLISLNNLELGNVRFSGIGAITAKNSKWGMLNCISAFGIIGYNIIQTCIFQIDYEKKQIIITDKEENLSNSGEIQWITYKPISTQETPIIPAVINDSVKIDLFFDTGMSGGISLSSSELYSAISQQFPEQTAKYTSRPSLQIRGEKDELEESLIYRASSFSFGNNFSEDIRINIDNTPVNSEREYTGLIGNRYFEDYIITLDYRNRRVGFIPKQKLDERNNTFGITFLPNGNKMIVSSIYKGFKPDETGIQPGDEVYSINDIKISELKQEIFCEIYRKEYSFSNPADSILHIEIIKDDSLIEYKFKKQSLFDNVHLE